MAGQPMTDDMTKHERIALSFLGADVSFQNSDSLTGAAFELAEKGLAEILPGEGYAFTITDKGREALAAIQAETKAEERD